ncbi:polyprenyl synthetase family protein [Streptomyces sp. NPDC057623]|uniref:polyprenyl synthetase family protein n=1 Tax=Streptomyces sp. NPDC057623 TaxID=3346187 RepID=UPI0036B6CDDE
MSAAAAVELVHNFSLVHDDVIDRDELRRHRPTVWAVFGVPAALLCGDALLALALQAVAEARRAEVAARSVGLLCAAVVELVEGEALDTAFEQRDDVSADEYTAMAVGKTGALMGAACALGALAGGAEEERAQRFQRFGRHVGLAFQITDDLLGLYGDRAATGKPVGSDIASRKKTLPVLAAMGSGTEAGDRLTELYARPGPLDEKAVRQAVDLVDEAGGRATAERTAAQELRHALTALDEADPAPAAVHDLTALVHLMTHRSA